MSRALMLRRSPTVPFISSLVEIEERQRPDAARRCVLPDATQGVDQRLVVAHHAAELVSERHHHRAGERGEVDHGVRLDLLRGVGEGVGQDQAPLGVGVEHLDARARSSP